MTGQNANNTLSNVKYSTLNGNDSSAVTWDIRELDNYFKSGMPANLGSWAYLSVKIDKSNYEKALQPKIGEGINCKYVCNTIIYYKLVSFVSNETVFY